MEFESREASRCSFEKSVRRLRVRERQCAAAKSARRNQIRTAVGSPKSLFLLAAFLHKVQRCSYPRMKLTLINVSPQTAFSTTTSTIRGVVANSEWILSSSRDLLIVRTIRRHEPTDWSPSPELPLRGDEGTVESVQKFPFQRYYPRFVLTTHLR